MLESGKSTEQGLTPFRLKKACPLECDGNGAQGEVECRAGDGVRTPEGACDGDDLKG